MTYNQLLSINQSKAKKEVLNVFNENTTKDEAYNIIYNLSESKQYRYDSVSFYEFINDIINKAYFAKMECVNNIKAAFEQYDENEAAFNRLF